MKPIVFASLVLLAGCGIEIDAPELPEIDWHLGKKQPVTTTTNPVMPNTCDLCTAIAGRTFVSDQDGECGKSPNGVAMCRWSVRFDGSTVAWQHSDFEEYGALTCNANGVAATFESGTKTIVFDPNYACGYAFTMDGMRYLVPLED